MPGIARTLLKPPNATLPSRIFSIPFTTGRLVVDPNERFGGIISSLLITNRDTVNPILVRLNNGAAFNIAPNLSIPFNEQWIDLVDITPNGAVGAGSINGQVVANEFLK